MAEKIDPHDFEPLLEPKFLVLGLLFEYMGRDTGPAQDAAAGITVTSPSPDRRAQVAESFFPNEQHLVSGFCSALSAWGAFEGLDDLRLDVERGVQGHDTVLSEEAAALINSCYKDAPRSGLRGNALAHEGMFPKPIRHSLLDAPSANSRFSYLLGCHRRWGNGSEFRFANAGHQVDLVVTFLEQVGCPWLQTEWRTETVPRITIVRFEPTEVLARWLNLDDSPDLSK